MTMTPCYTEFTSYYELTYFVLDYFEHSTFGNEISISNTVSLVYTSFTFVRNIRLYVFFHIPRRKHHVTNTFNYSLIRIKSDPISEKNIIHLCVITC